MLSWLRIGAVATCLGASTLPLACYEQRAIEPADDTRCTTVVNQLFDELYEIPQGCAAVMEYSASLALERWALVCRTERPEPLDELQARRFTECCEEDGTAVNRDEPRDAFVFFDADDEGNGHVAVVSQHITSRIFETRLRGGDSTVVFPASNAWRPANELAIDCRAEVLVDVTSYSEAGDAPPVVLVDLLDSVGRTGIVDAMRKDDGELLWTIVVRTGAGSSDQGGWAVLLQSSSRNISYN